MLPVGLLSLAGLTAISYFSKLAEHRYGSKSEIAALLTLRGGRPRTACRRLDGCGDRSGQHLCAFGKASSREVRRAARQRGAALKFLIVSIIILPIVPN